MQRHQRVVAAKNHLVIQLAIDPGLHDPLDIVEVGHHVARVERLGLDLDFSDGVVSVRMFADAVVVEQPMAVAEVDTLVTEHSLYLIDV